jgi:hypothetical protein
VELKGVDQPKHGLKPRTGLAGTRLAARGLHNLGLEVPIILLWMLCFHNLNLK